jgi:hypothetical protein
LPIRRALWVASRADNLQLYVSVGAGLNDAAPDSSVSAGVAWRFFLP